MRSTILTGGLFAGVGAILILPALSARPSRPERHAIDPPAASSVDVASSRPSGDDAFPAELDPATAAARRGSWDEVLPALALVRVGTPRAQALRDTLAAEASLRLGDAPGVVAFAARAIDEATDAGDAALAAHAAFVEAQAHLALGEVDPVAGLLDRASRDGLPALAASARRLRAETLLDSDPATALALVASDADLPSAEPDTIAFAARAAAAAGDRARAGGWLLRLADDHLDAAEGKQAAASPLVRERQRALLAEGHADQVLARADALLEAGLDDAAAPDIEAAAAAGVPAPLSAELALLQGRLWRMRRQPAKALPLLVRAAASTKPEGCRAAFHASRAAESLKRRADAAKWLERAANGCPCEWRDRAALELATAAESDAKPDAARLRWRVVADTSTDPDVRRQAAWELGWSSWTAGHRDDAAAAFESIAAAAPESREAAASRYWLARLKREKGDADGARGALLSLASDFPRDWYGVLAAEETGIELPAPPACADSDVEASIRVAAGALAADPIVAEGIADVEALGLVDDALLEADASPATPQARAAFRSLVLSRAGRSRESLREFRRAVPDWRRRVDVEPALACAAWPLAHGELLISSARATGLEPALVFGLVHQESAFDETAVSHAGARGLMQVMPATGRTIAKWLGERVTNSKLIEPAVNVRYGTTYLRRLLDESGRAEVALAGYNAGPGRARRWWAASGDDVARFVESIPLQETRDYVKAIAVNERLYRARLAEIGVGPVNGATSATTAGQ